MVKLYDLFKEIELRTGQLPKSSINDKDLYEFFFLDFFKKEISGSDPELKTKVDSSSFNKIKKIVISELNGYQLVVSPSKAEKKQIKTYILNPSADNFKEYIVGYIEIKKVDVTYKFTKAYKIKGAQVYLSYISELYRGKGIGTLAYEMVLDAYGTLFSDDILYEGSRNLWVNKIIPMVKENGGFFGGEGINMYIPLSSRDAADDEISSEIDRYMASLNPPSEVKKLDALIKGVDITSGDLWIYVLKGKTNDLFDLVEEYREASIENLIDENPNFFERYLSFGDEPGACIVRTIDAVVLITQTSDGINATLI